MIVEPYFYYSGAAHSWSLLPRCRCVEIPTSKHKHSYAHVHPQARVHVCRRALKHVGLHPNATGAHTYPVARHANHSLLAEAPTAAAARALMKALAHVTSSQCKSWVIGSTGLERRPGCGVGAEPDQGRQT
jgi:hypothetical protein